MELLSVLNRPSVWQYILFTNFTKPINIGIGLKIPKPKHLIEWNSNSNWVWNGKYPNKMFLT